MDVKQVSRANFERHIHRNSYPGRGLVIGRSSVEDAWLQIYWIMGRSQHSQNRRFVVDGSSVRTEPVDAILEEMARGAAKAGAVEGQSYFCIADRAEAIRFAVDLAQPGDLVIACGKGHEQSMCYGTVETPWSEHRALRSALLRRMGSR